ncbi:uncharacterized protein LOC107781002 isoform X2 [Nicotiana tabacum]|uniref:Uncharacterized protein LOC107781002 isoform X2 n=2 Tax=Nicotiana tabacum TaxID=4097 RepID=A0AC58RM43_TOBAC
MLGISYGELFVLLGATAALIGPKDLPIIARTAGRFAGRSIGYVQLARGQFESVMQQSQARQDYSSRKPLTDMHSQAAAYARLAETTPLKSISIDKECLSELTEESGSIIVLPVSAESAGLLPKRKVKWMI